RQTLGCTTESSTWNEKGRKYQTKEGFSWIEVIHDGDHKYPSFAPDLTIRFFKEIKPIDGSHGQSLNDNTDKDTQSIK
ncbi:MAG: hypothetical protein RLY14_2592, partial [Planctomycetota bacterium]